MPGRAYEFTAGNRSILRPNRCPRNSSSNWRRFWSSTWPTWSRARGRMSKQILAEHPELAEALRPYFDRLDFLHQAAAEFGASPESPLAGNRLVREAVGRLRDPRRDRPRRDGRVYEAQQISLDRRVALKVLPFAAVLDQRQIARFQQRGPGGRPVAPSEHRAGVLRRLRARRALLRHAVHRRAVARHGDPRAAPVGRRPGRRRPYAPKGGRRRPSPPTRLHQKRPARPPPPTNATGARRRPSRRSVRSRRPTTSRGRRTGGAGGRGPAARPRLRHRPSRHQAVEPAARRPGQAVGDRFRPGPVPDRGRPDASPATWWARCAT